jgi:hypothetical protein
MREKIRAIMPARSRFWPTMPQKVGRSRQPMLVGYYASEVKLAEKTTHSFVTFVV